MKISVLKKWKPMHRYFTQHRLIEPNVINPEKRQEDSRPRRSLPLPTGCPCGDLLLPPESAAPLWRTGAAPPPFVSPGVMNEGFRSPGVSNL
ncbi:hypothetical protein CEXT_680411 [Caerostris extrusa]|uniref:Uncharacterized protein n=1 Tax=Caerostris extrusa TaxID=172846 RepID=A0AAV4SG90_CAEEX|nr:hypothetical protein CEXT_680411 [Caerostris extrusa]